MRPQLDVEYLKTKKCLLFDKKTTTITKKPQRETDYLKSRVSLTISLCRSSARLKMSETATAGFTLYEHVTQIHSSFVTNRTETKDTFQKVKISGSKK